MECFQNKRLWNKGEKERLLRKRTYHLAVTPFGWKDETASPNEKARFAVTPPNLSLRAKRSSLVVRMTQIYGNHGRIEKRETASAPKKRGSHHSHPVMLNLIQHLKNETLKRVQGDATTTSSCWTWFSISKKGPWNKFRVTYGWCSGWRYHYFVIVY